MKKIILIIFMAIISGCSYYGAVNENGEKVTSFENVEQEQNEVKQEEIPSQPNIQSQNEVKEEQQNQVVQEQNIQKIEIIENDSIPDKTQTKSDVKNDIQKQENKVEIQNIKSTTNTDKNQIENNKNIENTNNQQMQAISQNNINSNKDKEVKKEQKTECIGNNHKIDSGNTKKWFETEEQAESYYNAEQKKWGKKWENYEIDDNEYDEKCPYGYEVWDCPVCKKWTINFYYRK